MLNKNELRRIEVVLPASLVNELEQGLVANGLSRHRSRAIALAMRRFLDDGGLDQLLIAGVQWPA